MPPRSAGQKLVAVPMNEDFITLINEVVVRFNYSDRAKLIREAIAEKLERHGIKVPKELIVTPSRIGKAGRPPKSSPKKSR